MPFNYLMLDGSTLKVSVVSVTFVSIVTERWWTDLHYSDGFSQSKCLNSSTEVDILLSCLLRWCNMSWHQWQIECDTCELCILVVGVKVLENVNPNRTQRKTFTPSTWSCGMWHSAVLDQLTHIHSRVNLTLISRLSSFVLRSCGLQMREHSCWPSLGRVCLKGADGGRDGWMYLFCITQIQQTD